MAKAKSAAGGGSKRAKKGGASSSALAPVASSVGDGLGLQAVVLVDAADDAQLQLLAGDGPKCLLTIAGVPLLEYTLEFLASQTGAASVGEVLLFSARHASALRSYLAASRWASHVPVAGGGRPSALPVVRVLSASDAECTGDALRVLDGMGALRGDSAFVLVDAPGVVGTASLAPALAAHAVRARADVNTTLTVVVGAGSVLPTAPGSMLPQGGSALPARRSAAQARAGEVPVFALDARDGRIWGYSLLSAPASAHPAAARAAAAVPCLPKDVAGAVAPCAGLEETGVYVCSPSVLVHFSDNQDYTCVRRHYLRHEARSVDMGWRFHAHALRAPLAAVRDARSLAAAAAGVAGGWAAPLQPWGGWWGAALAPACALAGVPSGAGHGSACARVAASASCAANAELRGATWVGQRCTVGAGAVLDGCVLGDDCAVGAGAVLCRATLLNGARVGAGARVTDAVLGPEAAVGDGATVPRGVVLGAGVRVAAGTAMPTAACVVVPGAGEGSDAGAVGAGGHGRLWPSEDDDAPAPGAGGVDEDDEEEGEGGDALGDTAGGGAGARADAALARVAAALAPLEAASDTFAIDDAALAVLGAAVRAALRLPCLQGAPGCPELDAALQWLPWAPLPQRSSGSVDADAATTSPLDPASPAAREARFARGVAELVGGLSHKPSEADVACAALEVQAFRHAENASFAACLRALVPPMVRALPAPLSLGALAGACGAWGALLARFVPGGAGSGAAGLDAECALVHALEDAVRAPSARTPGPLGGVALFDGFGVALNALYDAGAATATAIQLWAEEAEEGGEGSDDDADEGDGAGDAAAGGQRATPPDAALLADREKLLASKWVQMLLSRLEEEEEDDDEEEEEEEE